MTHLYSLKPAAHYAETSRFPGELNYVDYLENWNMAWLSHDWENGPPPDREEFQRKVFKTVNTHHVTGIVMARDVPMRDKIGGLMANCTPQEFVQKLKQEPLLRLLALYSEEWLQTITRRAGLSLGGEGAEEYLLSDEFCGAMVEDPSDSPDTVMDVYEGLMARLKAGST